MVKTPPVNAGDAGSIPGLGRSRGEGNGNPFHYSCLEHPMDRETCGGYSPWGRKESDRLNVNNSFHLGRRDETLNGKIFRAEEVGELWSLEQLGVRPESCLTIQFTN